tara:strand:- start:522 stop:1913 length:1392 start_codon:yes stop_codon:yes gene_type:complete
MELGLGSIDRDISRRERMLAGNSAAELQRKAALSKGLVELLATQMALSKRQSAENQINMLMGANPDSIKAQKESELVGQSLADVTRQTAGILGQRKRTMNQNMRAMAKLDPRMLKALSSRRRGLAAAPVPKVQTAAQGGIVGYASGNEVEGDEDRSLYDMTIGSLVDYAMENPYSAASEAAGLGLLAVPAGKAVLGATKGLKGLYGGAKNLLMGRKPISSTLLGGAALTGPTLGRMFSEDDVPAGTDAAAREAFRTARDFAPDTGKGGEIDSPGEPPAPVKTGDSAAARARKAKQYDDWLTGVITVLTAPGGLQNMGRAYVQHTQRVLNNQMGLIGLEIQRGKIAAMNEANKLKSTELTTNNLIRRINDIDKLLQDINQQVMESPVGISFQVAKDEFQENPTEKNRAKMNAMRDMVQVAIADAANSMGTDTGFGGSGLLGQKAFLIEKLNAMEFDMTRQPKQT